MKTFFPCEEIVKIYLPAMRASIAKKLYEKGFTQKQIAGSLGLTQPAVSKYLSNDYGREIRRMEGRRSLEKACSEIAEKLAGKTWGRKQVNTAICSTCTQFNFEMLSCSLLEEFEKTRGGA